MRRDRRVAGDPRVAAAQTPVIPDLVEEEMIKQELKGDQLHLTFVLPSDEPAGKVSVVGDFNDWTPGVHTLVRRSNGTRSVRITVPAGQRVGFRYLAEGGHWFDDPSVEQREAQNGVLVG
jgi:hypothetical protein